MNTAKKFLGEEQASPSINESLFSQLFYIVMNKELTIIKSKVPLPYQDESHQHAHDTFEFTVPLSHSPQLFIEKRKFSLPRRNIFPCNPGQYHGPAEDCNQHRIAVLQFAPHELQEAASSLFGNKNVEFQNTPSAYNLHLEQLVDMFIYENQNKQAGYEFILEHLSGLLSANILRTLKSNLQVQEKHPKNPSKKDIIRTMDYLHTNYNNDFSLMDVAEVAGLSKFHFIRVFKKETGKTPYQFFLDIKIEKAKELIKTHKYSITEICFMCGFKNHSHFTRLFFKKTGMPPTQFESLCK